MSDCQLPFNSSAKIDIIVNIRIATSSLSLLGSLFVISTIWLFKKYVVFTQRLILYIGFAALLSSIAYMLGRIENDFSNPSGRAFCRFQGFIQLYTDWTLLLSFSCITFNLYWNTVWNKNTAYLEKPYFIISFLIPSLISCFPFIDDSFGPSGAWCWIQQKRVNISTDTCSTHRPGKIMGFVLWYIPLIGFIIVMFVTYAFIVYTARKKVSSWQGTYDPLVEQQKVFLKQQIKPLMFYPTVYLLVSIFPTINRVYDVFVDEDLFALWVLHVIFAPLAGALVAITYAVERDTLQRFRWSSIKAAVRSKFAKDTTTEYPVEYIEESKECGSPRSDEENTLTEPLI